jgi:hypothetical protein
VQCGVGHVGAVGAAGSCHGGHVTRAAVGQATVATPPRGMPTAGHTVALCNQCWQVVLLCIAAPVLAKCAQTGRQGGAKGVVAQERSLSRNLSDICAVVYKVVVGFGQICTERNASCHPERQQVCGVSRMQPVPTLSSLHSYSPSKTNTCQ